MNQLFVSLTQFVIGAIKVKKKKYNSVDNSLISDL